MNQGDTAWVLISAALVLLMTPGLAFFYGGMVRAKSVLNMLMMSVGSMAVVGVLWILYGYSFSFGKDVAGGWLADPAEFFGLSGLMSPEAVSGTIPTLAFVAFQAMFAIITVALISGAIADRTRFVPWLVFAAIWVTVVYFPVAHWVFDFDGKDADGNVTDPGGWIANQLGAIDFAGGTAVHINAGAAALALVLVLGKRRGWPKEPMKPHNLPFVVLGAGLLWFGWFGFNAGSALAANTTAAVTFVNTIGATAAAMIGWLVVERFRDGKPTTLGAASGIVAGLVAITPACSAVSPIGALAIGVIAGVVCALAVGLKYKLGYDDSLDVVGVHLVGGLAGTLLIGLFATDAAPAAAKGLFYGGGLELLGKQAVGAFAVLVYSFVLSLLIGYLIKVTIGFRVEAEAEVEGIDDAEHAESAYDFATFGGRGGAFKPTGSASTASLEESKA
ncbi:ammonium transporter [Crossiella sp. CA-258035]|uniref:ammonium transporter n=1 Tax=Crossiella sp. CA-258035 TaxID=2981138 RepID=UPI0024BD27A2|nr:ammonium transporter [Crossiella sp. CA-258035]WHT18063.1 ammonium transporter [Crossiella sp. CA-258035]